MNGIAKAAPVPSPSFIQQQHALISNRVVFFHRKISDGLDFDYNNFQYFNINDANPEYW